MNTHLTSLLSARSRHPRTRTTLRLALCFFGAGLLAGCGDDQRGNDNQNQNQNNSGSICGNGTIEGLEECDDGPENSDSLADACRTSCLEARCGDDVVDTGEECDDGFQNSDNVPNSCRLDCTPPSCGDAVVDTLFGEGCDCGDGSVDVPQSCSGPNSDEEGSVCLSDCRIAGCGDGLVQGLEQCDGNDLNGESCSSLGFYFDGNLGCTPACLYDTQDCNGYCGDGVKNGPEHCDGSDLGGYSCQTFGFQAGPLGCSGYCMPDTNACKHIGWKPEPSGTLGNLVGVSGTSSTNVCAAATNYGVLCYDGQDWALLPGWPTTRFANSVWTSPDGSVFVGSNEGIYKYDGTSWVQAYDTTHLMYAAWGSSPTNIWFAGTRSGGGVAYWVHYNGSTWTDSSMSAMSQATGLWGSATDNVVWVVGMSGITYRYNGTSWAQVATGTSNNLRAVWGTSASNVYAVGDNGVIIRFNGASWAVPSGWTPPTANLKAIWGSGANDVYVMGEGGALYHYNGRYWSDLDSGGFATVRAIWGLSSDFHIAVGDAGQILRGNGKFWDWSNLPPYYPSSSRVWGRSPTDIFNLAGSNVIRFNGTGWATTANPCSTGATWNGVWASATTNAFVVGSGGYVCRYTGSWSAMTSGVTTELRGIWGSDANNVIAVGDGGAIRHYSGSGSSWTTMTSPTTERLDSVWGPSATEAFAVGSNGTILHYSSGAWSIMASPTTSHLHAVWGASATAVFAAGENGALLRFDGSQWTQAATLSIPTNFWGLWGGSETDVFAVGDNSTIVHYDGTTWSPVLSPMSVSYRSVWGLAGSSFLFLGDARVVWLNYPTPL